MQSIIKTFPDGSKYGYIVESYRVMINGKSSPRKRTIYEFGNIEELMKEHPDYLAYMDEVKKRLEEEKEIIHLEIDTSKDIPNDENNTFNVGCLYLKKIFKELKLDVFLDDLKINNRRKYQYKLSDIVINLISMQILNPGSKKHAYDRLENLVFESDFELHDIYRSLDVLNEHADEINAYTYKKIRKYLNYSSKIFFYDCSDFYYSSLTEDELRKSKKSKEGIYAPLVQMGLLIDERGMLIGMVIFPGSANEQPSLKVLETNIKDKFNIENVVICTDAGLGSNENRLLNSLQGRSFICTHSLKKSKPYIKEYVFKEYDDEDNKISAWKVLNAKKEESYTVKSLIEAYNSSTSKKEKEYLRQIVLYKVRSINDTISSDLNDDGKKEKVIKLEQRLIITFSLSYYLFELDNFNDELLKANLATIGELDVRDVPDKSFKRFLKKVKSKKDTGEVIEDKKIKETYSLDLTKIEEEKKWFGYYAIATNLKDHPRDIIAVNKERWQIEYCFRTMKTMFKARAIYLSTPEHIKGHFEIVYLALNLFKIIQNKIYRHFGYGNKIIGKLNRDEDIYKDEITPYKIQETLTRMNIVKVHASNRDDVYVPGFKRTILVDALAETLNMSFAQRAITYKRLEKYT